MATQTRVRRPSSRKPIDTYNDAITMTPTLRKQLRQTWIFTRTDGIQLVHYDGPHEHRYVAYRWPSGQVQWYRYRPVMTITVAPPRRQPPAVDLEGDDCPF